MRKTITALLFIIGVAVSLYYLFLSATPAGISATINSWSSSTTRPNYVTSPVEKGDIRSTVVASGTIAAVSTVFVGTQL